MANPGLRDQTNPKGPSHWWRDECRLGKDPLPVHLPSLGALLDPFANELDLLGLEFVFLRLRQILILP